jgi:glycerol-3-phosphate dehydrogenase (NAD(P)+)
LNDAAPIAIVGGGAWGTALANILAGTGHPVSLWMRSHASAGEVERTRTNERYLPGVRLSERIKATADAAALGTARAVLLVVPTQSLRAVLGELAPALPAGVPLIGCAKGVEGATGLFPSEIVGAVRPGSPIAILSGPSFAADVARGLPTAVTLAAADERRAADLAALLSGPTFRVYHATDVRGVEIGGAAKNVLAIAVGIVSGRGLGESAKAALIARGFAELMRFAASAGGRPDTLMGLSGLGDLVLTCGSAQSRNFALGQAIGAGKAPGDATGGKLAEGVFTAPALLALARAAGVEMPICEAVEGVLAGGLSVDAAIARLMARPVGPEMRVALDNATLETDPP